jgi:hypothetical protein
MLIRAIRLALISLLASLSALLVWYICLLLIAKIRVTIPHDEFMKLVDEDTSRIGSLAELGRDE